MSQIKVELQETMGSDHAIANAAWTSSLDYQKKKSRTEEDVKRVVEMLANSKHSVPFESVVFRFWIKMPIATDRQFMSHRIASHSGMSGRYRTMPSEFLYIPEDIRKLTRKIEGSNTLGLEEAYIRHCEVANNFYKRVVEISKQAEKQGIISNSEFKRTREFYRGALPQHNMTERVTVMNLRSFANFIKLRLKPEAQPEIREVARQMLEEVKKSGVCPIAIETLEKNGWEL